MNSPTSRRRTLTALTATTAAALALSSCGHTTSGSAVSSAVRASSSTTVPTRATSSTTASTSASFRPSSPSARVPVTLAFAGDTQAYGEAEAIDTEGLGAVGRLMARADVAMVNLETAVADSSAGLQEQPKDYHFVTDSRILKVLKNDGIDVVTAANNHAMDYGPEGLRRMMVVKDRNILPMVGIGRNIDEAYAPFVTTVRGRNVVVYGASDVLEPGLNWTATATKGGLAFLDTPGGLEHLASVVRNARKADANAVIVVYLHWGVEKVRCPTDRQLKIAKTLADAGASVVVGSHAHIQQPTAIIGSTAVDYGLGNFVFGSGEGTRAHTGVLNVTVPAGTGAPSMSWTPALKVHGLPQLLTGADKQQGIDEFNSLDEGCTP